MLGVTWIDTAAVYGIGHSEEIVARALGEWKGQRPYVFTKCAMRWDKNGRVTKVHSAVSIREECEDSLRRLQVDLIDLYQIHWPPEDNGPGLEESLEHTRRAKDRRKSSLDRRFQFRCAAASARRKKIALVTSLQPLYSLIRRRIESEVLPYCERRGIGVIVYSPMASGLLTGAMTRERAANLPEDDWRRNSPEFREPRLSQNLQLVERLRNVAARYGTTPGAIAIAWTLRLPAVTGAIVGARNAKQAEGAHACRRNQADLRRTSREIEGVAAQGAR